MTIPPSAQKKIDELKSQGFKEGTDFTTSVANSAEGQIFYVFIERTSKTGGKFQEYRYNVDSNQLTYKTTLNKDSTKRTTYDYESGEKIVKENPRETYKEAILNPLESDPIRGGTIQSVTEFKTADKKEIISRNVYSYALDNEQVERFNKQAKEVGINPIGYNKQTPILSDDGNLPTPLRKEIKEQIKLREALSPNRVSTILTDATSTNTPAILRKREKALSGELQLPKKEGSTFKEAIANIREGGIKQEVTNTFLLGKELITSFNVGIKKFVAGTQTILSNPQEFFRSLGQSKLTEEFKQDFLEKTTNIVYAQSPFVESSEKNKFISRIVSDRGTQDLKTTAITYGTFVGTQGLGALFGKVGFGIAGAGDLALAIPEVVTFVKDPANPRKRASLYLEAIDIGIDFVPNVIGLVYTDVAFKIEGDSYINTKTRRVDKLSQGIDSKQYIQLSEDVTPTKWQDSLIEKKVVQETRVFAEATNTNFAGVPDFSQSIFVNKEISTSIYPTKQSFTLLGEITPSGVKSIKGLNPKINALFRSKRAEVLSSGSSDILSQFESSPQISNDVLSYNFQQAKANPVLVNADLQQQGLNYIKERVSAKPIYETRSNKQIVSVAPSQIQTKYDYIQKSRVDVSPNVKNILRYDFKSGSLGEVAVKYGGSSNVFSDVDTNTNTDYSVGINTGVDVNVNSRINANINSNYNTRVNVGLNYKFNTNINIPSASNFDFKFKPKSDSFKVQVRREGKFKDVFSNIQDIDKAFQSGLTRVRNTAGASFRILDSSGQTVRRPFKTALNDFYESDKEDNVYIEKRGQRINTAGELQEITFKGIQFNKLKGGF